MYRIPIAVLVGLMGSLSAFADGIEINQNAAANYSFVAVTRSGDSNIQINQSGRTNVVSSAQLASDLNQISAAQSGWFNTVVIYQDGFIDVSGVAQSAPSGPEPNKNVPTSYNVRKTDQGFLSTFASGEVSIATLTSSEFTYISHFGRRH